MQNKKNITFLALLSLFLRWIWLKLATLLCTLESKYWVGCRCRPYSNYWGGYSQIIGGIYPPRVSAPLVSTQHCFCGRAWTRQKAARFCPKKRNPFCFKIYHFPKTRIRYRWELGSPEDGRASVHDLTVTTVKSYFDPNKFQEYFNLLKIFGKKATNVEGKQISS